MTGGSWRSAPSTGSSWRRRWRSCSPWSEPTRPSGGSRHWHRAGYLRRERRYVAEPFAYAVTPSGLGAAGSDLSLPRKLDPATYAHDVGVAWLAAAAHRGVFGELSEIVCERRMRSEDARRGRRRPAPHGVRCAGVGGRGVHYPDLAVVTATGRRVAFELELHVKGAARRERILAAYACDPGLDAVVYLVRSLRASGGR